MELRIFNVSHGFCAYLIADNRNVMLFDCGFNERTGFRPSNHLSQSGCNGIECLVVHNFDQDHIADLPQIVANFDITLFHRNRSITAEQLRRMKEEAGGVTNAMESLLSLHQRYVYEVQNPPVFQNVQLKSYSNRYGEFDDTNNLSLVCFIKYDGLTILSPGDMEVDGWIKLLEDDRFTADLSEVDIFIASHHGRQSGYCAEVFDYCSPDIVIISDKELLHETQKQNYAQHASGVPWNGGPERRYVLTTRSDGHIVLTKQIGEGYHIASGVEL